MSSAMPTYCATCRRLGIWNRHRAAAWDTLLTPVLEHYEVLRPSHHGGCRRDYNLALVLWAHRGIRLRFLVPLTNNRAEQALCIVKRQLTIVGGFRIMADTARFARLLEPARKQDRSILDALMPKNGYLIPEPEYLSELRETEAQPIKSIGDEWL